jgi:hypothetical protein
MVFSQPEKIKKYTKKRKFTLPSGLKSCPSAPKSRKSKIKKQTKQNKKN